MGIYQYCKYRYKDTPQINLLGMGQEVNTKYLPNMLGNSQLEDLETGFISIGMRLIRTNNLLVEYCDSWERIHRLTDPMAIALIQKDYQTSEFLQEEIIYHVKIACDDMISLCYIKEYRAAHSGQTSQIIDVNSVGGYLEKMENDKPDPNMPASFYKVFTGERCFLDELNDLANACKHSVLNSLLANRVGTEEPYIVVTSMPHGKLAASKDCGMAVKHLAEGVSRVYRDYFDYFGRQEEAG